MHRALRGKVAAVVSLVVLIAITLIAGGTDGGDSAFPHSAELLLWALVAALAALHRPFGGLALGFGTLALPLAAVRLGPVAAALVAALARLAAAALQRLAARRRSGRLPGRGIGAAVAVAVATLAAAAMARGEAFATASFTWRASVPAVIYALVFVGVFAGTARLAAARGHSLWPAPEGARLAGLGLDTAGWVLGTLLADVAGVIGWTRGLPIVLALALLAAEAARNAILRGASDHQVGDLRRLQHAHRRILAETSGMASVAQQILVECSNILPVRWYQFELEAEESGQMSLEQTSWSAGPDGLLEEGQPRPEERPPMLPGVHRRVSWRVLEKALVAEGETLAVVRLWCDPRQIEPGAEELLTTLVPQMASSVHRARLDREARLDALTGIPVRRILDSQMQQIYRRCCEEGRSMAVIMCDIDHFKKVNDTHGHAAGDEALILVARALDTERRDADLLARYGGEEFTLLLDATSGTAALQLAERLRQAVGAIDLVYEGRTIPLTLSAGVAAFPELHIKTAGELLLLADEALYEAKEAGRDRCLLNLGRGAFKPVSGATRRVRQEPAQQPPRIFG
ncbi:MAG: GGDEF domain-containing protein [bacterium]|nr:GGDEF domain-containing protein [bacterium]